MNKKSIFVVLCATCALIFASIVLVLAVTHVHAAGKYATMYVGEESDFKIDENGVLTGLSDAAWTRYSQYTGYAAVSINVTIPDTVKEIADAALASSVIEKISIPNGVTRIGNRAFANSIISSITIPGSVEFIGENAFAGTFLEYVTIQNGVTEIGDKAFAGCSWLRSVNFPTSLQKIGNESFAGCIRNLKNIYLPEGLESIGDRAFTGCRQLERISIPTTVNAVGEDIFQDCTYVQITVENEDLLNNDNFAQYVDAGILHPAKVTVFFDTDGGTPVEQQSVNYGYRAQKPFDPTREGYRFLGWYLNDGEYYFSTQVTENITLTAKWEEVQLQPEPETLEQPEPEIPLEESTAVKNQNKSGLIAGILGGSAGGTIFAVVIIVVVVKRRRK